MQDNSLDGLGDEELMTVQGFDDVADYGALYEAPDSRCSRSRGSMNPSTNRSTRQGDSRMT